MKKITLFIMLLSAVTLLAQPGTDAPWMNDLGPNPKFQEIVDAFDAYWDTHDPFERGSGYKPFKRWESLYQDYVNPDGTLMSKSQLLQVWQTKEAQRNSNMDTSDWQSVGPFDHVNTGSWSSGQGRVNAMAIDPNNPNIYYAGAPAGGIWKSQDSGTTWTPLTDQLPQIGVSGIAVDPNDSNIIYIATGDDDAGDSFGIGVLKSVDGGVTWNFTGLDESNSPDSLNEIFVHPTNSNILWVATTNGVFKTIDGGDTWENKRTGNMDDLRLKPGDPNTLYAVTGNAFYKSEDAGETWTRITEGVPTNTGRLAIDVTPSNPEVVYILAADSGFSFDGIYKSEDSGENFVHASPGVTGIFEVNQAWYDMAFAVSDVDENELYVGELNVWKSSNGGAAFNRINSWSNPNGPSYTHADIHNLRFIDGKLFCGSDGGLYVSEDGGNNFTSLTEGLAIGQFYRIDVSSDSSDRVVGGLQDNGGYARKNEVWQNYYGADGMEVVIDPTNPENVYGFIQFGGGPYFSQNGGASLLGAVSNPESGNWITPLEFSSEGRLFAGYTRVYELNFGTNQWEAVSPSFGQNIDRLVLDPNDNQIMYAVINNSLRRSIDGGLSFQVISNFSSDITWVDVKHGDSNTLYISTSGTGGRVYRGILDGNDIDLEDITGSLPNLSKLVIKHQPDHEENPVFLGTSLGVWRYDDVTQDWTPFENNLPNVAVRDMEINIEDAKLTVGTYGRGVWQTEIATEPLSVNDFNTSVFNVSPNPSNGVFEVRWENNPKASLSVFDITGKRLIETFDIAQGENNHMLDLSSLSSGIYILKATLDDISSSTKIIIE